MSETAIERGRRFAERWDEGAATRLRWAEETADRGWSAFDLGKAALYRTRARWLRHAVLAMEERERTIYRERAELAEADLLGTLPELGRTRLTMLDDALDQIECGGRR